MFQSRLLFLGSKIDFYQRQVTLKLVRSFSQSERPACTAFLKAGRSLCLLLKAFTCMDDDFRQIKEEETFGEWSKIQQYLNSDQGERQIKRLHQLRAFCEQFGKLTDRKTLLVDMRKAIFKSTLEEDGSLAALEFDSPRVKTTKLKPIFCLAYFTMLYVTVQE